MPRIMKRTVMRDGGVGSITATPRKCTRTASLVLAIGVAGCGIGQNGVSTVKAQSSAFAVLNTARTSADTVPSRLAGDLLKKGEPSLSPTAIHNARRVIPNKQVWLVPAPEGVLCLVRVVYPLIALGTRGERLPPVLRGACSSEKAAETGRLMATQSLIATFAKLVPTRVYGIVPNGVRHVVARSSGKAARTVAVQRNAYEFTMINPRSVSFVTSSGGHQRRYLIPTPTVAGAKPYPGQRPR